MLTTCEQKCGLVWGIQAQKKSVENLACLKHLLTFFSPLNYVCYLRQRFVSQAVRGKQMVMSTFPHPLLLLLFLYKEKEK